MPEKCKKLPVPTWKPAYALDCLKKGCCDNADRSRPQQGRSALHPHCGQRSACGNQRAAAVPGEADFNGQRAGRSLTGPSG